MITRVKKHVRKENILNIFDENVHTSKYILEETNVIVQRHNGTQKKGIFLLFSCATLVYDLFHFDALSMP